MGKSQKGRVLLAVGEQEREIQNGQVNIIESPDTKKKSNL